MKAVLRLTQMRSAKGMRLDILLIPTPAPYSLPVPFFPRSRRNAHTDRISHPKALAVIANGWIPLVKLRKRVVELRLDL